MSARRPITEDERALMAHVGRFGSDGYPVERAGRGWTWSYRSQGPPVIFATKAEAEASLEAFLEVLRAADGAAAQRRAVGEALARGEEPEALIRRMVSMGVPEGSAKEAVAAVTGGLPLPVVQEESDPIGPFPQEPAPGSVEAVAVAAETIRGFKPTLPAPPRVCNCGPGVEGDKNQRCLRCGLPLEDPEIVTLRAEVERLSLFNESLTEQRDALADALERALDLLLSMVYVSERDGQVCRFGCQSGDPIENGAVTIATAEAALHLVGRLP